MKSKLPRSVWLIGATSFFTDVSSEMIVSLLPMLLLASMGATPVAVGLVDGLADAVSGVVKLGAGRAADRFGRSKPLVLAGYGLSSSVRPLIGLATSPFHVVLVRAVDRVGKGLRSAPRDALLAESVAPVDAPRAFALHRAMDHAGAVVGPLVATALIAAAIDVRTAMTLAWIPAALACVAIAFVPEHAATGRRPAPSAPLPRRRLDPLLVPVALFSLGVAGDLFALVRAREVGVADAAVPLVWVAMHVAKVLGASAAGRVRRSFGAVTAAAWLVVALGLVAMAYATSVSIWIGAAVFGAGHGLREPLEKELVRAGALLEERGASFGAYHAITGLCALPAGVAVGWLWTRAGAPAALLTSAAVVALSAAALVVVRRRRRS
jgi:hypothetical protein